MARKPRLAPDVASQKVEGGLPNIVVEVLPDNTVNHDGKHHGPGDSFEVEGPTAIALVQGGHVKIVGSK